jgi:hypothetical protein
MLPSTFPTHDSRMDDNKPRRRWLSFGIRDLLWATVVVGMAVGWWAEYRHSWRAVHEDWQSIFEDGAMHKPLRSIDIEYANGDVSSTSFSHSAGVY